MKRMGIFQRKNNIAAAPKRTTRSMTTDAARRAVLNTSELLENMISFLPAADIHQSAKSLSFLEGRHRFLTRDSQVRLATSSAHSVELA